MCGITGVFWTSGRRPDETDNTLYAHMTAALHHRGPDEDGHFSTEDLWFGFKRLSIIDLKTGQQPFFNEDKSIVCVCNGEIYNYTELKMSLIRKGHRFRSDCDVEVLVHLYEESGLDMFHALNGQFAIALYDIKARKLILARDHVGICPLFYTVLDGKVIFGSEIKSVLQFPGVSRKVNPEGLDQIFCLPGLCSPVTMFRDIHALKPGHLLEVTGDTVREKEYWDLDFPMLNGDGKNMGYYTDRLHDLLSDSIKYRLQADVPVGLYVSGGLDSSIIAGLTRRMAREEIYDSFGIVFGSRAYDERTYQRLVTKFNNTRHHEIPFDVDSISGKLSDMVYFAESPLKETYNTCSLALSQQVRNSGIKVVLTGEGADEVFAGYVGYRLDRQRGLMSSDLTPTEQQFEYELRERVWGDKDLQYEKNLFPYREVRRSIYSRQLNGAFNTFNCLHERLIDKNKIKGRSRLQQRSYLDFKLRLSDHLLADHGDRVAYANSVEARYPFLDINVIEFAKTIPDHFKVNDICEKYILREAFKAYLPTDIYQREKFGFVAPGAHFLMKQDIEWVEDMLSYESIKRQGYFNPDTVERLKTLYRAPQFSLSETFEVDTLMIVLTFQIFLQLFDMPSLS
jgi:asparagine synthase (glutamine-hydrolysing)